jgi:hypothetical protein
MRSYALTSFICFVFIIGCTNPFDTRTPEEPDPDSTQPTSFNLQNDPNTILAKIQQTFEFKDSKSYKDCFATPAIIPGGFVFIPDQNEASRFSNWTVAEEERYFIDFTSKFDVTVQFDPQQPVPQPIAGTNDTLILDFNYTITAAADRFPPELYRGRSVMRILKTPQEIWFIYRWLDLQETDTGDSTWSTLKANYSVTR